MIGHEVYFDLPEEEGMRHTRLLAIAEDHFLVGQSPADHAPAKQWIIKPEPLLHIPQDCDVCERSVKA